MYSFGFVLLQGGGSNETVTGVAYVADSFGAASRSVFAARVTMPVLSAQDLYNQSATLLEDALATSNTGVLFSV